MQVTNLRLIWFANSSYRTNLTIGYGSVVNINIRETQSRLCGRTQALYVLTKFNGSRFEFIFTQLARDSTRLFSTVQSVFRAYDTSKMYRELKLRGAVMKDKELVVLPQERVFNKLPGVWNLSAAQGNLGTLFLTNVRVVWCENSCAALHGASTVRGRFAAWSPDSVCAQARKPRRELQCFDSIHPNEFSAYTRIEVWPCNGDSHNEALGAVLSGFPH